MSFNNMHWFGLILNAVSVISPHAFKSKCLPLLFSSDFLMKLFSLLLFLNGIHWASAGLFAFYFVLPAGCELPCRFCHSIFDITPHVCLSLSLDRLPKMVRLERRKVMGIKMQLAPNVRGLPGMRPRSCIVFVLKGCCWHVQAKLRVHVAIYECYRVNRTLEKCVSYLFVFRVCVNPTDFKPPKKGKAPPPPPGDPSEEKVTTATTTSKATTTKAPG